MFFFAKKFLPSKKYFLPQRPFFASIFCLRRGQKMHRIPLNIAVGQGSWCSYTPNYRFARGRDARIPLNKVAYLGTTVLRRIEWANFFVKRWLFFCCSSNARKMSEKCASRGKNMYPFCENGGVCVFL